MATTATVRGVPTSELLGECRHIAWTLALGESGEWQAFTEFAERSVQFGGSFSGGASVKIEGSNDLTSPSTANTLHNPFTNDLILRTVGTFDHIAEMPLWIRPVVIGGDGSTAITINLVVRRQGHGK